MIYKSNPLIGFYPSVCRNYNIYACFKGQKSSLFLSEKIEKSEQSSLSCVLNHPRPSLELLWVEVQRPKRQSTTKRPRRRTWQNTWSSPIPRVCNGCVWANPKWCLHRANRLKNTTTILSKWCDKISVILIWILSNVTDSTKNFW